MIPLTLIWFPVVCGLIYNSTNLSITTLSAVLLTSAVIASVITAVALYFYIRRRQNCAKPVSTGKEAQQESLIRTWLARDILSGTGRFTWEGGTYRVNPGEIFVIPPFLETYYEADAQQPWSYIWVGFTSDIGLPEAFQQSVLRCAGARGIFEDMRRCQNMHSGKSAFLAGRIWELIALVLDAGKIENGYVEKALHCMQAEYMTELTVAGLAARLNLDRCYFSTLFTKQVGVSPSQYLMHLRLEKAAELMLQHNQSPSVAAASVGYTDIYNFSKMFKKKYGCSPRHYRAGRGANAYPAQR